MQWGTYERVNTASQHQTRSRGFALGLTLLAIAGAAAGQSRRETAAPRKCDAACLTAAMDDFLTKMLAHRMDSIKISPRALVFVNTHPGRLDDNPLTRVKAI